MAEDQALELMQSLLEAQANEDEAQDLVRALDCIPLAVKQAAAYINRRSPRVTTKSYLESFCKSEKRKYDLLRNDKGDLDRQAGVSNSVVVTWQVTLNQIRAEHPSAANLLSLMSQFQAQDIPEFMLRWYTDDEVNDGKGKDSKPVHGKDGDNKEDEDGTGSRFGSSCEVESSSGSDDTRDDESERIAFENDLDVLRSYSLVDISKPGHFSMHSLVQFCTRRWLSEVGDSARWHRIFIKLAAQHFPVGHFEDWPTCQALLPHIEPILGIKPKERSAIEDWAALLDQVSEYTKAMGQYSRAQSFAEASVEGRGSIFGKDHLKTLESRATLASILRLRGKVKEAGELGAELLKASMAALGVDHTSTLAIMTNIAEVFSIQSRLEEAEKLQLAVFKGMQTTFGLYTPETLPTMNDLALTYRSLGRLQEAETLQVDIFARLQTALGLHHPHTLIAMGNLALTFSDQGRLEEAEKLQVAVMVVRKAMFGLEHPYTLDTMRSLASIFLIQGRLDEAESLQVEVLEKSKVTLGLAHFDTLASLGSLCKTMQEQGRFKEVEDLEVEAIEVTRVELGPSHPDTLISMYNLALTWHKQGWLKEAIVLLQDCACLEEEVLGRGHPSTRTSLEMLQGWQAEVSLPEETEDHWETQSI